MKDYEYIAYVCNNILYGALLNLKASGLPAEDIYVMLDCIGKALVTMSINNKSIDYYMHNIESLISKDIMFKSDNEELSNYLKKMLNDAKWIKIFENPYTNGYICSRCGHKIQVTDQFISKVTECEVCGAEMKGVIE